MTAYRLLHGNALDRDALPAASADLIVTSPPYNLGMPYGASDDGLTASAYAAFTDQWLANAWHWTRSTGRLCINVALDANKYGKQPLGAEVTAAALRVGWRYHATILWLKGNLSSGTAWGSWCSATAPHIVVPAEVIVVCYKDEWNRDGTGRTSDLAPEEFKKWVRGLWTFNGENRKPCGHPAAFPRELPRRCIKLFSFVGDTVLDPFSGSGTTMIEAVRLGRDAVGLELDRACLDAARARIDGATPPQLDFTQ